MQDKNQKSNKFLYQGSKQKTNSWGNTEETNVFPPLSNGTSTNAGLASLSGLNFKGPGFDVNDAWSIRRNVPLPSSNNQVQTAKNTTTTSYYSRHVNNIKGGTEMGLGNDLGKGSHAFNVLDNNNSRGWNFKKPEYSYGAGNTSKRQMSGNEDEGSGSTAKRPSILRKDSFGTTSRNQGRFQGTQGLAEPISEGGRKQSARTQKAKKLHNAYLKSAGLGQYATDNLGTYSDENPLLSNYRQKSAGSDRSF